MLPYLYDAKRFKNKWNPDQKNPFPIEIKKEKIKAETSKPHQSRRPVFGKQGSPGNEYSPKAPARKVNTRYSAQDSFQVNPPTRKSGRKRKAQTQDEDKSDIEIIPAEPAEIAVVEISDSEEDEDEAHAGNTAEIQEVKPSATEIQVAETPEALIQNPNAESSGPDTESGVEEETKDIETTDESSETNDVGEVFDPTFESAAIPDETEPLKHRTKADKKYYCGEPSPGRETDSPKSGNRTPTPHCTLNTVDWSQLREALTNNFGDTQFTRDTLARLEEIKANEAEKPDSGTGINFIAPFIALNEPTGSELNDDFEDAEVEAAEPVVAEIEAAEPVVADIEETEEAADTVDQNDNVAAGQDKPGPAQAVVQVAAQDAVRVITNGIILDDMHRNQEENEPLH